MKKILLTIAILLPFCGMAQTKYCLLNVHSDDNLERTDYMYGNNNELIAYELYDGIDQNDVTRLRDTLIYDDNGDCVMVKNYQYRDNNWLYTWYVEYEYDANHNRTSRENYNSFDGVNFDLGGRYEYTYDENNRLISHTMYFVGSEFERGTYTYNAQGNLTEIMLEQNDPWGGTGWSQSAKTIYTYNESDICVRIDNYYNENGWVLSTNNRYTLDEYNNVSIDEVYYGDQLVSRVSYAFDNEISMDDVIYPIDPESYFNWDKFVNRPNGYGLEMADEQGVLQYVCDYILEYCEVYDAVSQIIAENDMLQVYPNPTEGTVTLMTKDVEKVVVMDMAGNIVLDQSVSANQIDLSGVASGLYIIKAFNGIKWNYGKIQVK